MQKIDEDENLKFIREQSANLTEKQLKQLCIPAILGYAENLRRAISEDDLLTMRRYEIPKVILTAFKVRRRSCVRRKFSIKWRRFRLMMTRNFVRTNAPKMSKLMQNKHRKFGKILCSLRCFERSFYGD